MKRIFTLLSLLMVMNISIAQTDTLVMWSFPTGDLIDTIADVTNDLNATKYIYTAGGTSDIQIKNGDVTFAAQASGWDEGQDLKSWQIEVNTMGYSDLKISSKQTAGGNDPGPRDFKIQFKAGEAGTWTDIANSTITVANDWTTGVVENLDLPEDCEEQELLYIRWLMTSNMDINGNELVSGGKGKIDDILISGTASTLVNEMSFEEFNIYPNPASNKINIICSEDISSLEVYTFQGQLVKKINTVGVKNRIDVSDLPDGLYLIVVQSSDVRQNQIQQLHVRH